MAITATYISPTQFSVNGDYTTIFIKDRRVKANCSGTYKYGTILSVIYIPNITTITLTSASDDIDVSLIEVEVGIVSAGVESSLPIHSHDGGEGSGGPVSLEGAVFHNSIGGLQGGTTNEYYHITAADFADFITATEVNTISGAIQDQLDNLTTDHGDLTGLSDNDHPQYLLGTDFLIASGILNTKIDTTSGTLQNQITNIYNTHATDLELTAVSGSLQNQLDNLTTDHGDLIGLSDDDHPQYVFTDGTRNITGQQTFNNNVVIRGNLVVSGTQVITEVEDVLIEDHLLTLNYGETGSGISFPYAGIEIERGTAENYLFVYDEVDDNFQVGISGSLQPVATREDTPVDTAFAFWNASEYKFNTSSSYTTTDFDNLRSSVAGVIYYLVDVDVDFGYELMMTTPASGTEDIDIITLTNTNETLVGAYITASGTSLGTVIPGGIWDFELYGKLDNLNSTTFFTCKIYKMSSGGVETLLFSTSSADINSLTAIAVNFDTYQPDFVIASTDRLVLKIYAQTTSGQTINVTYYYQGTERYSHFKTPISALIISDHGALQGLADNDHPQYALATDLVSTSGILQNAINNINITVIEWNAPSTTQTYQGITSTATVSGTTPLGYGSALRLASNGAYYDAYATAAPVSGTISAPCVALATYSGTGSQKIFKFGYFRNDAWDLVPGYPVYLSTISGGITQTLVSGSGQVVQILGYAENSHVLWFEPNKAFAII